MADSMVTIKDVAQLSGVSIATVSRALASPEKVSEKARAKVFRAVSASGYVTNTLARNFRRRRSNMVVVLVPDITNPFFANIIQGIEQVASKHQYRILLGDTRGDENIERDYAGLVSQKQADGVICLGRNIPFSYKKGRKSVDPSWPPFVMACEYHGDISVPTVCTDNILAARDAVNHLLELGHRDIGVINGPVDSPLSLDRLEGCKQALTEAGIQPRKLWVRSGDFTLGSGYSQMESLLNKPKRPTAVFCANDEMAIGAMQACRDNGMILPEDMSIVGFDDIGIAQFIHPRLTTIHQPRNAIGERVMSLMLGILSGKELKPGRVVMPHRLVVRQSTAPYTAVRTQA